MNFSHENYVEYGWGSKKYGKRTNDEDRFWIKYNRCEREPLDFKSECLNAARLIYESTEKKIYVHYSGGIDSEVVCLSFIKENIPFEVVTWVYKNDLNKHDICYAIDFCKRYGIKQNFIEINIRDFIFKTQFELGIDYFIPVWQINLFIHVGGLIKGCQICGDNDPRFVKNPLGIGKIKKPHCILPIPFNIRCYRPPPVLEDKIYRIESEYDSGIIFSFFNEMNIEFCKNFFYYTPELIMSYINEDLFQDWLTYSSLKNKPADRLYTCFNKDMMPCIVSLNEYEKLNPMPYSYNVKPFIKRKHFPEIGFRPKYSGIEKIKSDWVNKLKEYEDKYYYNSPGNNIIATPGEEFIESLKKK